MKNQLLTGLKANINSVLEALQAGDGSDAVNAYYKSSIIKRALSIRMSSLASIPIGVEDGAGEMVEESASKTLIEFVNGEWNQTDLIKYTEGGLSLYDNGVAWEKIRIGGIVRQLMLVNPSTITKVNATTQGIESITQKINNKERVIPRSEFVYFRPDYDPTSDLTGRAWARWAAMAGMGEYYADKYLAAFWANDATPSLMFTSDQQISNPVMEQLLTWWRTLYKGVDKKHSVGFIGSGFKPVTLGSNNRDLALLDVRTSFLRTISEASDVPEMLISVQGMADLTPVEAAMSVFARLWALPRMRWIIDTLNSELMPEFEDEYNAGYRYKEIIKDNPIFAEDENKRKEQIRADAKDGIISKEAAARLLGYEASDMTPPTQSPAPVSTQRGADMRGDMTPQESLRALDLERWQTKAIKAIESGKPASVPFTSDRIAANDYMLISERLAHVTTRDEVKAAFIVDPPITLALSALDRATKAAEALIK